MVAWHVQISILGRDQGAGSVDWRPIVFRVDELLAKSWVPGPEVDVGGEMKMNKTVGFQGACQESIGIFSVGDEDLENPFGKKGMKVGKN